ncbi:MBL fold metallo-hydrolase [Halobacteriales archaeon Cl-PHB]
MVHQITAARLADKIDADDSFVLVDTRPADSYEAWHVRDAVNVPYDPDEGLDDDQIRQVRQAANGRPVYTVCGKGLTSTPFAFGLEEAGLDEVTIVRGGMREWAKVYEVVPIATAHDDLVVRQVQRRGKGCLGYVVGSDSAGEAYVVDATRQVETFEVAAQEAGLRIVGAIDTHVHADHLSGTPALADALDVPYYLGAEAADRDVQHDFEPVADGDVLSVGDVDVRAIHAPGHTSDMVNYHVADDLLLSSDTLFVDSVGRTELQFGEDDAATGARLLYETLQERLFDLPDDTTVLPGHVAVTADGHMEGGTPGEPIAARLGELRESLDLLGLDEETFVERVTEGDSEKPANYEQVIAVNTGHETVEKETEATDLETGPNNCAA